MLEMPPNSCNETQRLCRISAIAVEKHMRNPCRYSATLAEFRQKCRYGGATCRYPMRSRRRAGCPCPQSARMRNAQVKSLNDFKSQRRALGGENYKLKLAERRGKINVAETASQTRAPRRDAAFVLVRVRAPHRRSEDLAEQKFVHCHRNYFPLFSDSIRAQSVETQARAGGTPALPGLARTWRSLRPSIVQILPLCD
jgi:hypothetical protein